MQPPPLDEIEILRANIPAFCENYTTVGKEEHRIDTCHRNSFIFDPTVTKRFIFCQYEKKERRNF